MTLSGPGISISVFLTTLVIAILIFIRACHKLNRIIKSNILLRKVLTWAAIIVLTSIFFTGILILVTFYENYYPSRDFNESAWRADREKRYEMTGHLIKSEILIGKTQDEVKKMLGSALYEYGKNQWIYDIGARPGFHLEPDFLKIHFENGKVEKVEQHGR
jgi:hypothetical protein